MTAQELNETGQRLFKARQYAEALPLLKSAAEAFPKDECLWQKLVLAAHHCGQYEGAVESTKQAIRQHPRSGWLWRQLGSELTSANRLEEAENAFDNARSLLGHSDEWLWRYYAALHKKRKNLEKEIEAWENLHTFGAANSNDLHDETKRAYHWAVFRNKRLLRFLTRGDIGHFFYADDYFPRETLELLDEEPEFRAFLSKPFARQYNVALTRAIERRLFARRGGTVRWSPLGGAGR